ncbi:MAG: Crp/Fnr family transcriptional regulator [Bacteroidota bacterium]|nr:Crp/Fnr family transcriptional regulator [Bacteroidota bacterium]
MIKEFLERFKVFTKEEIEVVYQLFTSKKLNKFEYFVREGDPCTEIAFIKSGVFRSYYLSGAGEEITYCFRFQNDLMAAYSSFITGEGSLENMQALSSSEILVIKKTKIDELVKNHPNWMKFLKIIAEQQYIELEKRIFHLQRDSAVQKYRMLIENQPEYIQKIPLQYLSSYLGITQRHLSRIRKELTFRHLS